MEVTFPLRWPAVNHFDWRRKSEGERGGGGGGGGGVPRARRGWMGRTVAVDRVTCVLIKISASCHVCLYCTSAVYIAN